MFGVRFLLSHNLPGSVARFTADTASLFARQGIPTTVLYPALDWIDYRLFTIPSLPAAKRWRWVARLAGEAMIQIPLRRGWCGFKYFDVDPKVRGERFLLFPSARKWKEDEITVIHPPYLIPHLLRSLPHSKIKLVSAIHMNLEKAMSSPFPETAAWYRHWVARERMLSIPRYTTSEKAREAAERLGIPIRRVIHDGSLDLRLFRPALRRSGDAPLQVSLYCDPNLQKGQAVGVEAMRSMKSLVPGVRLCSVGRVLPRYAKAFDRNYGYLHKERLVQALQESDIFVYPSLYDGFPAPPLQAMACGAALVTTAVEGVLEYAREGENCLLSPPGQAPAMREQVLRLVRDAELRQRLQSNGPQTAQRYTVERSAGQLLEFLKEVYQE